jgi:hypothetical protein
MLGLGNREQCEQYQMTAFDVSCATCERSDQECPWGRRDEPTVIGSRSADGTSTAPNPSQQAQKKSA